MPNTLERFAEVIISNPANIVLRGGIKLFGLVEAYLPARTRYKINGIPNDLFEANQPYAVKRVALEALGGLEWDIDLKNSGEDSDLLLKVDREEFKLTVLDEPLYGEASFNVQSNPGLYCRKSVSSMSITYMENTTPGNGLWMI